VTQRIVRLLEKRRVARSNSEAVIPSPRAFLLYLFGALLAVFLSGTLLYYGTTIALLPPDYGGPQSRIPGHVRAGGGLVAGAIVAVLVIGTLTAADVPPGGILELVAALLELFA
jgi:hypothetical protein